MDDLSTKGKKHSRSDYRATGSNDREIPAVKHRIYYPAPLHEVI